MLPTEQTWIKLHLQSIFNRPLNEPNIRSIYAAFGANLLGGLL